MNLKRRYEECMVGIGENGMIKLCNYITISEIKETIKSKEN